MTTCQRCRHRQFNFKLYSLYDYLLDYIVLHNLSAPQQIHCVVAFVHEHQDVGISSDVFEITNLLLLIYEG